jgi:RNA binding exosome subunit
MADMKLAHTIKLRVFINEDEDYEKIREKLVSLFPFDLEQNKINIQKTIALGAKENKIIILKIKITKDSLINQFIKSLDKKLGDQKEILIKQLSSRTDEQGRFFIRLDKKQLLKNRFKITDSGSCFHIEMHVAAFPMNKENAMQAAKSILKA